MSTVLTLPTNATVLSTYLFRVRRLLHDANASFYTDLDLTDYINQARDRVARDTACLRNLAQNVQLTAGQEIYAANSLPGSPYVLDVFGVTLYYGTQRFKLGRLPWSEFDVICRPWVTYQQRPVYFTRYSPGVFYVGPKPDQDYLTDWDVIYTCTPLASDADAETIPIPFQEPVQFFAAHLAKYYEQSYGESKVFEEQYKARLMNALATYQRMGGMANPYYVRPRT